MRGAVHEAPAIIVTTEQYRGTVPQISGVEGRANFVQGNPFPIEFDFGNVRLLGNAGDSDQFASHGGNIQELFVGLARRD